MINRKILAPVSGLFDQGYKLSYFCEDLSKYVENQLKSAKTDHKVSRTLKKWFKFKTFFAFIEDGNIERTSNKIENVFQKTFPKSVKRLMKIKRGVMSRINTIIKIQTQKQLFDI